VVLPDDLVEEVDRLAGRRKRSEFVEAAIREKLARGVLAVALTEAAGMLNPADYPEWQTPEAVSAWVRASRRDDDARLARKVGTRPD
jgi:hypothetical protein